MNKLLCCRRGSVAFGTLAAMLPLIGMMALGAEAGSWYIIRGNEQNAADAAALAGAYTLAANPAASLSTIQADGTLFATKNGFLASEVTITKPAANQVQAVIIRQQPQAFTKIFFKAQSGTPSAGKVAIKAAAVAQVNTVAKPCLLALTGSISFQGSPTVNAPNCGMVSDDTANDSINFTGGGGINVSNVGSISGAGGCTGNATLCSDILTYGIPETNPYAALNSALSTLTTGSFAGGQCPTGAVGTGSINGTTLTITRVTSGAFIVGESITGTGVVPGTTIRALGTGTGGTGTYTVSSSQSVPSTTITGTVSGPVAYSTASTATECYNGSSGNGHGQSGGYTFPSSAVLNGTYFFAGPVSIGAGDSITGTANLILLPGASLGITGNPMIQLTGGIPTSTSVPSSLSGFTGSTGLLAGLLIYDPETTTGNGNGHLVNITGNSSSFFDGVVYAPNAAVTYTGSSTNSNSAVGCNEVIAAAITYAGNTTYLDNSHCPVQTAPINYVTLIK